MGARQVVDPKPKSIFDARITAVMAAQAEPAGPVGLSDVGVQRIERPAAVELECRQAVGKVFCAPDARLGSDLARPVGDVTFVALELIVSGLADTGRNQQQQRRDKAYWKPSGHSSLPFKTLSVFGRFPPEPAFNARGRRSVQSLFTSVGLAGDLFYHEEL